MCEVWPDYLLEKLLKSNESRPKCMWPKLARFLADIPRDYSERRSQLGKLVSLTDSSTRKKLIRKLQNESDFLSTVSEMKAVSRLLVGGIRLSHEMNIDGKTPDWSVLNDNNNPAGIIEATTCTTTEAVRSIIPLWTCLCEASIKSDKYVCMSTPDYHRKWTDDEIKNCIEEIRTWCEQDRPAEGVQKLVHNVRFTIGRDRRPGMESFLSIPGHIKLKSSGDIYEAIDEKVVSYRGICQNHQLPLAVVLYIDEEWVDASIENWSAAMTGVGLQINQQKASVVCPQQVKPGGLFFDKPLLGAAGRLEITNEGWRTIWLINPNASHPFDSKLFSVGSETG